MRTRQPYDIHINAWLQCTCEQCNACAPTHCALYPAYEQAFKERTRHTQARKA